MAATAPRAYLSLAPGTDRDAALAAIRTAIAGSGVQLLTRQQLVDTDSTSPGTSSRSASARRSTWRACGWRSSACPSGGSPAGHRRDRRGPVDRRPGTQGAHRGRGPRDDKGR